jgi:hypothetical protein
MDNLEIFIPLIIAAASFAFNVWNNIRELNYKKEVLKESKISDKRKELAKKLNEFYGPFMQNLKKSTSLYRALTSDRGNFRLLDCLLDEEIFERQSFNENDKTLIKEIVDLGIEQQGLIKSKGGLIDDYVLLFNYSNLKSSLNIEENRKDLEKVGLIAQANSHYRILELAYNKKLFGDVKRFEDYRFPRSLPDEVERRIKELQTELDSLRNLV